MGTASETNNGQVVPGPLLLHENAHTPELSNVLGEYVNATIASFKPVDDQSPWPFIVSIRLIQTHGKSKGELGQHLFERSPVLFFI